MIGTYYNTENKMTSTLTLNNKGPHLIAVTPILYNLDGGRFIGSPITVAGEASENVELGLLAAIAGSQFRAGSFEFSYEGRVLEMGGGLRIVNETKSLIFDEQMLEPGMKFSSPRMEAVYSIPFESVEASVILSNKTDKVVTINGDAVFAGSNGHHPINGALKPYQTSIVKLPPGLIKKAAAGAVTLSHNGGAGALMAIIHLQEPDKGFSAAVNFADPGKGKTNQYHGAGLRLGSVNGDELTPIIAVRNLGSQETSVTGRIPFTNTDGSQGKVELRKTALAAGEIKLLSVPGIAGANLATAGLELEYDGAPGSVIADALSVSDSGNQVFTLPLKDPQGGMSSTGGYPWFITDTSSTVVFIKNTTAEPQQFHLDIIYAGGRWGSNLKTLVPGQTIAFDLRKIQDAGEIGSEGNTIPANASSGHIAWKLRGARDKVLIGRAQTVDAAKGMASTYECQCTCGGGFYASRMTPGSVTGFPGDTTQFFAQEQDANCFGFPMSWYNISSSQVTFSSDNSGVATIASSGLATAVAPGTTNLRGSFETMGIWYSNPNEGGCVLQPVTTNCSAVCEVADCSKPTGETTMSTEWDNIVGSTHKWVQRLLPFDTSFAGRVVFESDPGGGGPDTCWFEGSERPKFTAVTGGTWTVAQGTNEWGPDKVGWSPASVTYYRAQGRAPCSTKFMQTMVIKCPNDPQDLLRRPYVTQELGAAIGATTVSSTRAGLTVTRSY